MVQKAEEGVAITVFFDEEATDAQIKKIGDELKSQNGVLKVNFVSADEAWDSFKDEYFGDAKELADGFKDDNPLSGSDNYEVYMSDVSKQKDVVSYAEKLDGVSKVNKSDVVAKTLTSVNRLIYYVSIVLIGILLAVSIFLISNTRYYGYYRAKRRDCDHEIYWSKGRIRPGTVYHRRSCDRTDRCGDSAGDPVLCI